MKYPGIIKDFPFILHGGDYNPDQWLDHPEIIDRDIELMKKAHCNTFSVGIFSWTSYGRDGGTYHFDWLDDIMNRFAANNIKAFIATPSGAMPARLALKYPEIRRVDAQGHRAPYKGRHNHCWTSPVYRENVRIINGELARHFAGHPALGGWHISNEYHGECFCELCLERFREFLRGRYGSLDGLNRAWYSNFWNHYITDWSEINPLISDDPVRLDWRRFTTEQCRDFMRLEVEALRKYSDAPVTTNMMGFCDLLDYKKIAEVCDFISDDVYPDWNTPDISSTAAETAMRHDYHRAMKQGRPFLVMESVPSTTNWHPRRRLKRPGMLRFEELLAIAHGADGAMYFQWRKSRGALEKFHGAVVDHVGTGDTRVFGEVADLGAFYEKISGVRGGSVEPCAAVIFEQESRWALDVCSGPVAHDHKQHIETLRKHYFEFYRRSIPVDVISSSDDFSKYRIISAPQLFMLKPGVAERLRKYVENGGVLVSSALTGYVDVDNQCFTGGFPGGGLMELFGIWNEELDEPMPFDNIGMRFTGDSAVFPAGGALEIIHAKGAQVIAEYVNGFYAGTPAATVNRFGKGAAYYIAASPDVQEVPERIYSAAIAASGAESILPRGNEGIHASLRSTGDEEYLFVFNLKDTAGELLLPDGVFTDADSGMEVSGRRVLLPHDSKVFIRKMF